ncbi:hypothetical protein HW423_09600 [Aerococcaceae bacterium INB8]|uniref:Uncharacterized protein n=1 Tax=Ruoffia halotolerans TaxID=2748684 RepID=A0A839A7I6_9LACT|nr:hypothetical protein [Ruoffia halotolerans]MBA5730037.1 hypothetical protein [Ruoffia halotolerans]
MRSIEEIERLIELVMKEDITFEEALKLVDSWEKERERFDDEAELMENSGGAKKIFEQSFSL